MSGSNAIESRKLILVGKTGNGKSATGNTILGYDKFESELGPSSVTQKCETHSGINNIVEREFVVVDTPGLFDTDRPLAENALEIQNALELCPNPHAFLIIMNYGRYTEEEKLTPTMLRVIFGDELLKHAVLVFTRGTEVKSEKFKSKLKQNASLDNLQTKCGGRVVQIENNAFVDSAIREKMTCTLFDLVEKVSDGGKTCYQHKSLDDHRKILVNHLMNKKCYTTLEEELSQLTHELERRRSQLTQEIQLQHSARTQFYSNLAAKAVGSAAGAAATTAVVSLARGSALGKEETVAKAAVKVATGTANETSLELVVSSRRK